MAYISLATPLVYIAIRDLDHEAMSRWWKNWTIRSIIRDILLALALIGLPAGSIFLIQSQIFSVIMGLYLCIPVRNLINREVKSIEPCIPARLYYIVQPYLAYAEQADLVR
jgi:hypothetical protein